MPAALGDPPNAPIACGAHRRGAETNRMSNVKDHRAAARTRGRIASGVPCRKSARRRRTAAAPSGIRTRASGIRTLRPAFGRGEGKMAPATMRGLPQGSPGIAILFLSATAAAQAPVVDTFTPTGGPPGTRVTIAGSGLGADLRVAYDGQPLPVVARAADREVTVEVP